MRVLVDIDSSQMIGCMIVVNLLSVGVIVQVNCVLCWIVSCFGMSLLSIRERQVMISVRISVVRVSDSVGVRFYDFSLGVSDGVIDVVLQVVEVKFVIVILICMVERKVFGLWVRVVIFVLWWLCWLIVLIWFLCRVISVIFVVVKILLISMNMKMRVMFQSRLFISGFFFWWWGECLV